MTRKVFNDTNTNIKQSACKNSILGAIVASVLSLQDAHSLWWSTRVVLLISCATFVHHLYLENVWRCHRHPVSGLHTRLGTTEARQNSPTARGINRHAQRSPLAHRVRLSLAALAYKVFILYEEKPYDSHQEKRTAAKSLLGATNGPGAGFRVFPLYTVDAFNCYIFIFHCAFQTLWHSPKTCTTTIMSILLRHTVYIVLHIQGCL